MKLKISLNDMHHPNMYELDIHKGGKFKRDELTLENHYLCLMMCQCHSGTNSPKGGDDVTFRKIICLMKS